MKKRKLIWSITILIMLIFMGFSIKIYQNSNEKGICSETGTRLSEKELRARVLENFLWKLLKVHRGDRYLLWDSSIAVVSRNIDKDEIISLIKNSSGRTFLNDIKNEKDTVVFNGMDISGMMESLGFFKYMFASDEYKIRHQEALVRKVERVSKELFHGDFSIVIDNDRYSRESQDCGEQMKGISIIPGDMVFLNTEAFRKKYEDFSASWGIASYSGVAIKKRFWFELAGKSKVRSIFNEYGNFFYQYKMYSAGVKYDNSIVDCRLVEDEIKRQEKIREKKDMHINLINDYEDKLPRFLAVSDCGSILEYYRESAGSGMDRTYSF